MPQKAWVLFAILAYNFFLFNLVTHIYLTYKMDPEKVLFKTKT